MPHSVSDTEPAALRADDGDIELSDAPPIEHGMDNCDDSDIEQADIKAMPSSTADAPKSSAADTPPTKGTKLEAIFDDDDEYGMEEDQDPKFLAAAAAAMEQTAVSGGSGVSDPGIMLAFYQRLFPFRILFQWLNHSPAPSNDFGHREFAFTLANEAYLRYQAFSTGDLLRRDIIRLNPTRFEIGPVYNTNPRDRKQLRKAAFFPVEKELVFDIDMTDYDDIRTCCDKAKICNKCWSFVTMAIQVIDVALKEDLGFKHVLWVYSGRRGAHAWVCDQRARVMDDQKRRAIASYLEVVKGGSNTNKKVNVKRPLHPHLARSLDILKEMFKTRILEDQDPWRGAQQAEKLLRLLPDKALTDGLRKKWESQPDRSSWSKWEDIDSLAKTGISKNLDAKLLRESKQDIILEYMYPRLDAEVSKHLNHLLKSPFCVHPGTGRVCVPIDASRAEEFDPLQVPTVTQLLDEINQWDRAHPKVEGEAGEKIPDYDKTSLKGYVDFFKGFVIRLMKEEMGQRPKKELNAMEY
ncbi:hypothetical protein BDZ91DRAFT_785043 [Kalaharituber pfeilii]|nr:hypothetical protein BDZ91DRAFT_785043 [Kalaharituber pfeilii]